MFRQTKDFVRGFSGVLPIRVESSSLQPVESAGNDTPNSTEGVRLVVKKSPRSPRKID